MGDGAGVKAGMLRKLEVATRVDLELVRHREFEAKLEPTGPGDALCIGCRKHGSDKLEVTEIDAVDSPVTRWNRDYSDMPLVVGDLIAAVNGRSRVDEMVSQLGAELGK